MNWITNTMIVPHPPIILPNIGKGEEKKIQNIIDAYRSASKKLIESDPETVVIISPHAPSYYDYIQISKGKKGQGNLYQFNDVKDQFEILYDQQLIHEIDTLCREADLPAGTLGRHDGQLDHGAMIPLYFLKGLPSATKFVRIGIGGPNARVHYALGQIIAQAAENLGRKIAIVASGDLSHCQKEGTTYGFKPCGPRYDEKIMNILSSADFLELMEIPESESEDAMVCGTKSFCVMAGALDGVSVKTEDIAHSAAFGVGYGVVSYEPVKEDENRHFLIMADANARMKYEGKTQHEDEYVALARRTINAYIKDNEVVIAPTILSRDLLKKKAGVFVSIHKDGRLRGCIGTTAPTQDCIADEIIQNAISAATRDPRFPAIQPYELLDLEIHVDVLCPPEKIEHESQLDVKKYGVIVSKGNRKGLLLPDLEGIDSIEEQIKIAKQKAGIGLHEQGCQLERFEVERHQ